MFIFRHKPIQCHVVVAFCDAVIVASPVDTASPVDDVFVSAASPVVDIFSVIAASPVDTASPTDGTALLMTDVVIIIGYGRY